MALTVEDGTGLEDADTYATLAEADARFELLGGALAEEWNGASDAEKEMALKRASVYVDLRFSALYVGQRTSAAQAFAWPRSYAYTEEGFSLIGSVPKALKNAVAEYAARALTVNLLPDPTQPFSQAQDGGSTTQGNTGRVISKRSKAGAVESEVHYSENAPRGTAVGGGGLARGEDLPSYPSTDMLLRPILRTNGQSRALR